MLFAIEPGRIDRLIAAWSREFPDLPLTRIGGLVEISVGESLTGGWEHFSIH
jgi:hypothetical protein